MLSPSLHKMGLHRELAKALRGVQHTGKSVPWHQTKGLGVQPNHPLEPLRQWWQSTIWPIWFRYYKGPWDRWHFQLEVDHLRAYGMMYDDTIPCRGYVMERALELVPHDIMVHRYRRDMRASELSLKKAHLPTEYQNYDPMVPYMAPYIEEAKFMIQEEMELVDFHPWDRRLYKGGTSGLGERGMNQTFFTSL